MDKKNVLLVNLPGIESHAPPIALATLKGAIEPSHQIKTFDLNLYINQKVSDIDRYLLSVNQPEIAKKIEVATTIFFTSHPTGTETYDVIGISILSLLQEDIAKIIINVIKKHKNAKIIAGGPFFVHSDKKHFNKEYWVENIDAFIVGDAEISLKQYLDDNVTYKGINGSEYDIKFDRDAIAFPNYDDFDLSLYNEMNVVQSKGCVRRCSFCTVPAVWPKYVYKSGSRMADEILYQYNRYFKNQKPQKFHFIDSLINGSKKLLDHTSSSLIQHFGKNRKKIFWGGQAICTSENHIPLQLYKQAAEAGLSYVIVGVESGSESVRWDMNKKFKDVDIVNFLKICYRMRIEFAPLMLIGFPTETENDFQKTLDLLKLYKKFGVKHIVPQSTALMSIGPNMDVTINAEKYGISNIKNSWVWDSKFHDFDERISRIHRYATRAVDLGLTSMNPDDFVTYSVPNVQMVKNMTAVQAVQ